jgi:hypothetical protein
MSFHSASIMTSNLANNAPEVDIRLLQSTLATKQETNGLRELY